MVELYVFHVIRRQIVILETSTKIMANKKLLNPTSAPEARTIISEKVIGKIIPEHSEFGHFYRFPSGKLVSSVTTKLVVDKPHLVKWAAKMAFEWMEQENRWQKLTIENRESYLQGAVLAHTDVRDDAGNVGTQGHNVIDEYMKIWIATGNRPEDIRTLVPEGSHYRVVAIARAAEAIFNKFHCVPIATEIVVGSEKWNCAGSLDAMVMTEEFPGFPQLELWDWKSSNNISDSYAMQVSAYKSFFEEMTGLKIAKCKVVKLDKYSDKFKIYNIPNLPSAFKAFKAISSVYDWLNNSKSKLTEDKKIIKV